MTKAIRHGIEMAVNILCRNLYVTIETLRTNILILKAGHSEILVSNSQFHNLRNSNSVAELWIPEKIMELWIMDLSSFETQL